MSDRTSSIKKDKDILDSNNS